MNYYAVDRWSSGDSLAHYKYIKKIKIGPFTRYFYSMKDLQNYYNSKRVGYDRQDENFIDAEGTAKTLDKMRATNDRLNWLGVRSQYEHYNVDKLIDTAARHEQAFIHKNRKENKRKALLDTGKFALKNLFGFKSKSLAKKKYKNGVYVNPDVAYNDNTYENHKKHMYWNY